MIYLHSHCELTVNDDAMFTHADGTDGAVFSVTNEVKIGRDKDSDIRVKIPSVSRNHARVYQDENGNVSRHSFYSPQIRLPSFVYS